MKGKVDAIKTIEISSFAVYNSLFKNPNIIVVVLTDTDSFLNELLHHNLYNHIILITNKKYLIKKFLLYAVTNHIFMPTEEINSDDFVIK